MNQYGGFYNPPGGIHNFLFGEPAKTSQMSNLTPEQGQYLQQLMSQLGMSGGGVNQGMQYLQDLLNPQSELYKNFEKPYMEQFEQQVVPGLAERFAGAGAQGGALSSSGFGQALGSAGANLQTQLAQLKSMMQRQAVGDLFNQHNTMAGQGLGTRAFENIYQPQTYGLVGNALNAFAGGAGRGLGFGGF